MRKPLLEQPRLSAAGKVIGRPRAQPPLDAAERIRGLAEQGCGVKGVALAMHTDLTTLKRWFEENPELLWAFEFGREQERNELHIQLRENARDNARPNISAMFLLKCRHGYREGDSVEQPGRINITFNLPGAMDREAFLKTVVNEVGADDGSDDGRGPG